MAGKNNNAKRQDVNVQRAARKRKKKKNKALRSFLIVLSLVIVGVAVFVATIRFMKPDYDFSQLVPQSVVDFVDKKISGISPDRGITQEKTTVTTTKPVLDYLEFEEFDFNTARQGNYLGNLLGGGKVGTDLTYIYYIVDGEGIYRFNPNTEAYTLFYEEGASLGSMNLRGDYIYFVNEDTHQLFKLQKGKKQARAVADNVRLAYVYDSNVYFVTTDNSLCTMDVKGLTPITVYSAADEVLDFVGISLERVFFTVTESDGTVNYLTIDNFAHNAYSHFRESTYAGEIMSMQLENGFMYYYQLQADGTYDLCRRKFGSERVVTLVENVTATQPVIVDENKLYFSDYKDGKLKMKELNMNSGDIKTLLKVSGVEQGRLPSIQHGWEYDFIIGEGKYSASCIYTSSTNVMRLDNNKWKY